MLAWTWLTWISAQMLARTWLTWIMHKCLLECEYMCDKSRTRLQVGMIPVNTTCWDDSREFYKFGWYPWILQVGMIPVNTTCWDNSRGYYKLGWFPWIWTSWDDSPCTNACLIVNVNMHHACVNQCAKCLFIFRYMPWIRCLFITNVKLSWNVSFA